MLDNNVTIVNTLMYVIMTDIDVLDPSIVFCILGEGDCACIISVQQCGSRLRETHLRHHRVHPQNLLCSPSYCHILSFCCRQHNSWLILHPPCYWTSCHEEDVARTRTPRVPVTTIISINIPIGHE